MHHTLKIEPQYLEAKEIGNKPFEVRFNDRGFQKGDTITYTKTTPPYAGYEGIYEITYVTGFAQKESWVVFGDKKVESKSEVVTGLENHRVQSDRFEPEEAATGFAFPCNVCIHNTKSQDSAPCNSCGHNLNANIIKKDLGE